MRKKKKLFLDREKETKQGRMKLPHLVLHANI